MRKMKWMAVLMAAVAVFMTACGTDNPEKTLGKIVGTWRAVDDVFLFADEVIGEDKEGLVDYMFQYTFGDDGKAIQIDDVDTALYDYIYSESQSRLVFMQDGAIEMICYVERLSDSELVISTDEFSFDLDVDKIGKLVGSYRGYKIYRYSGGTDYCYKKDGRYYPCSLYDDGQYYDKETLHLKKVL